MQDYSTIIGVIGMRLNNISYDIVQKRYGIGSSTVTLIMKRFEESGLSLDDLKSMEPKKVQQLFYPTENLRHKDIPMPDFQKIHLRLLNMEHRDLSFLWLEYKAENPTGYQLTQFYKLYNDYVAETYGGKNISMAVERVPGEKLYIDWVGDQPMLMIDRVTGEASKVHIFTTTLGFSSMIYAEIFPNEKIDSFIAGVTHALTFYGAIPKYLVPDNLKTAITKHNRDELVLNSAFSDLEDFYEVIVLPPSARKPKGKASVESHVKFLETHLVEKLKEDIYTDYDSINEAVKKIVNELNNRPFTKNESLRKTRIQAFEEYDKPRMRVLPDSTYSLCDYRYILRVPNNYHIEYDGHYYSVLYTYCGKPAILKATMSEIRICDENNRLICRHIRSYKDFPRYITKDEHMPAEHKYYKDVNAYDGNYYRRWSSVYGEDMAVMIDRILRSAKHEEQAYKSCAGILHMCKDAPRHLVEEAAHKCIDSNLCKYSYFKRVFQMLMNGKDSSTDGNSLPEHQNIRGRDNYQ